MSESSAKIEVRRLGPDDAQAFSDLRRKVTAENPGVRRVNLQVYVPNEPALALYRAIGFEEYGRAPNAVCLDGSCYNGVHMTLSSDRHTISFKRPIVGA